MIRLLLLVFVVYLFYSAIENETTLPVASTDSRTAALSQSERENSKQIGDWRWVTADRLNVRSCPSKRCGQISWVMKGQRLEVLESKHGWSRVSNYYDAVCRDGASEMIDLGNRDCSQENGIGNEKIAQWVSSRYLTFDPPAERVLTPKVGQNAVLFDAISGSFDLERFSRNFLSASQYLLSNGKCTLAELKDSGGWAKATGANTRKPVYFTYCGGFSVSARYYLNVESGKIFQ